MGLYLIPPTSEGDDFMSGAVGFAGGGGFALLIVLFILLIIIGASFWGEAYY